MKAIKFFFLTLILFPNIFFAQFLQQGPKLVGTGYTGTSILQGYSVSLSSDGNTALVGGRNDNSNYGAAWVYTRTGNTWTQQGNKLTGTGAIGNPKQGTSVALSADGNTAIVGGTNDSSLVGAVWIFTRVGNTWTQQGPKLVGTGHTTQSAQGWAVAISGDGNTAAVGGFNDNGSIGAIWVYTRIGNSWFQQGNKLVGSGEIGAGFLGWSIALSADGNTLFGGAVYDNSVKGAGFIFTRVGNSWFQQAKLVASPSRDTSAQGVSVSLSADGNTAIMAGAYNSTTATAWIFTRIGNTWYQGVNLFRSGYTGPEIDGGIAVSLSGDGNTAILAGDNDNSGIGAIWSYTRFGNSWYQLGTKYTGTGLVGNASLGTSVAASYYGTTVITGGQFDNSSIGAAWVFVRSNYYSLGNTHFNIMKSVTGNQNTYDTILVANDLLSYYTANVNVTIDTVLFNGDGNLELSLIHAGKTDTLIYQTGGSGSNFIETVLKDSALINISGGTAPFTGSFRPSKPLSQFLNTDPSGSWILRVYDRTTGTTGTLEAWSLNITVSSTPISVRNISQVVPNGYKLMQNYPNPFNPSTKIKFDISKSSFTKITIYDILGREVSTLVNEQLNPGTYEAEWNASKYSSGVYFYKLATGDYSETKRMVLVK